MREVAALAAALALAACKEAAAPAPAEPPAAKAPVAASPPPAPSGCVDQWLAAQHLNEFGDPAGTMYPGGTPLFDERTGQRKDRLQYLHARLPALQTACGAKDGG